MRTLQTMKDAFTSERKMSWLRTDESRSDHRCIESALILGPKILARRFGIPAMRAPYSEPSNPDPLNFSTLISSLRGS